jgi:hypothetical protein
MISAHRRGWVDESGAWGRRTCVALVGIVLLVCGFGCGPEDTCSGGSNMSSPRLASGGDTSSAGLTLLIAWDRGTGRGADLPDSYFAEVGVSNYRFAESDNGRIADLKLEGSRLISVTLDPVFRETARSRTAVLYLEFPDRAGSLHCSHPGGDPSGGPDLYLLKVSLSFDAAGLLSDSQFVEEVHFGSS